MSESLDEVVAEIVDIVLDHQGAGVGGPHAAVKESLLKVLTPYSEANTDLAEENQMWMTVALNRRTEMDVLEKQAVPTELLRSLVDRDPCQFDHHGGCQAHGYLSLEPGETCPQHDLKKILEGRDDE